MERFQRSETSPLLIPRGTVFMPSTRKSFIVRMRFVIDTGEKAPVKISGLWGGFRSWLLDRTEPPFPGSILRYGDLSRDSVDGPIIAGLGGPLKVRTTLAEMFALLAAQPNGPKSPAGPLLVNGWANVFYVEDKLRLPEDEQVAYKNEAGERPVLRAVSVGWSGGGWNVNAYPVSNPIEWHGGFRVFSRNSCDLVPQAA